MKEGRVAEGKPTFKGRICLPHGRVLLFAKFACRNGGCCCRAEVTVLPQVKCGHSMPKSSHPLRPVDACCLRRYRAGCDAELMHQAAR